MTKKKSKSTKSSVVANFMRKHSVVSALVVVLLLLVGVWAVSAIKHQIEVTNERSQFEHADADLETLHRSIEQNIGKATQYKKINHCSYTSAVFEDGFLNCYVGFEMSYSVKHKEIATNTAKSIHSVLLNSDMVRISEPASKNSKLNDSILSSSFRLSTLDQCFDTYDYTINDSMISPQNELSVKVVCSGSAKEEYYPVFGRITEPN